MDDGSAMVNAFQGQLWQFTLVSPLNIEFALSDQGPFSVTDGYQQLLTVRPMCL